MDLGTLFEGWIGIALLVINLGIFVLSLRWLWLNYKASKIIIEFAEIFREAMEREARENQREAEMEEGKNGGKPNGSHTASSSM